VLVIVFAGGEETWRLLPELTRVLELDVGVWLPASAGRMSNTDQVRCASARRATEAVIAGAAAVEGEEAGVVHDVDGYRCPAAAAFRTGDRIGKPIAPAGDVLGHS
jgi:hypothetical protein